MATGLMVTGLMGAELMATGLMATGLMATGLILDNLTVMTSGPLLVVLGLLEQRRRRRIKQSREAEEAVVKTVDDLIAGLRSGASLAQVHAGLAARAGPDPSGSPQLLLVTIDQLTRKGGPAVPSLQRLRHTLMGRVNGRRRADAESAQALASAGLLLLAPAVFAAAVATVDPLIARFYLSDPLGAACVFVAVVLAGAGWSWMHAVTNSVVGDML